MSITIIERAEITRRMTGKQAEREYLIKGSSAMTEVDAFTAMMTWSSLPATIGPCIISSADCSVEEIGENRYIGRVVWKSPDANHFNAASSFSISFDIAGRTTHITQSLATVNTYVYSEAERKNFFGRINVDSDDQTQGLDIIAPEFTYVVSYTRPSTFFDDDGTNISNMHAVVGSVNDDTFQGFSAGMLLCTGISGSRRDDENWDIQYKFAVSKNETGLTVGGITDIAKKGWHYLWVYYVESAQSNTDGKTYVVRRPSNAVVEKVYPEVHFALLGI